MPRVLGSTTARTASASVRGASPDLRMLAVVRAAGRQDGRLLPMWNVGYYAKLFQSDHHHVATQPENNFFPTVAQAREAMRGARMVLINSPLNPTGTAISRSDEGDCRGSGRGEQGRDRPCMLVYDQVYWMLTAAGTTHANPVAPVPECAPYVVSIDAISKSFAATGLRVGASLPRTSRAR